MTDFEEDKPVFALVDDSIHSARLMSRTLLAADSPARVRWIGDGRRGKRMLTALLARQDETTPDMVIVDLKSNANATAEFIAGIGNLKRKAHVPVAAIAPSLAAGVRNSLLASGADAVFERHYDLERYRAEMEQLMKFWVRETVTWPIRA